MIKLRIHPNQAQIKILQQWFHTARYVYNKTVSYIQSGKHKVNFQSLRNKIVTAKNNSISEWEKETPKEIRANAVKDVIKAYNSNYKKLKHKHFKIHYKKKKNKTESIVIQKQSIKNDNGKIIIYPNIFNKLGKIEDNGENNLNLGEFNLGKRNKQKYKNLKIKCDCRISYIKKEYYLLVPVSIEKENKAIEKDITKDIGLDPGVYTFMTGFSNKEIVEFKREYEIIKKIKDKIDKIKSLIKQKKEAKSKRARKTGKIKKNINKYEKKLENIIDDLQWKTINYLIKNYDRIFLGQLENQKVVKGSKNRKLNRDINIFKHFQFRQRLKYKANVHNKEVYMINESYTSQTCTRCGELTKCERIYECKKCGYTLGRDIVGSRNMLIKGYLLHCT